MITVVIASYKYGHLAAQAIESVLGQTVKPTTVIFVDDGAGDCKHLVPLYPEVAFILRDKNLGIVDNFQNILMTIVTPYVLFLGADNYLRPDTLEMCEKYINSFDIVSYDIAIVGDERQQFSKRVGATEVKDGYNIWKFTGGNIETGNYIHGSSLYNTEKAKHIGYAKSGGSRSEEDWVLFRGMIRNGAKHIHIPEPMLYYRKHRENFNPNN